jgi:hypothetical protein
MMAVTDQHWYEPILNERGLKITELRVRLRALRQHVVPLAKLVDDIKAGKTVDDDAALTTLMPLLRDIEERLHEEDCTKTPSDPSAPCTRRVGDRPTSHGRTASHAGVGVPHRPW